MNIKNGELETLIQEKIDSDTEFQDSLLNLNEEDKLIALDDKKQELLDQEIASLKERADKAAKAEELAKNYKIRAEKAEAEAKKPKGADSPKTSDRKFSLDEIDEITALSSIPKEDRQEVMEYAERKGIKPSEALNTPIIKVYLKEQEELRKSAVVTNVGGGRRGIAAPTFDQVIAKFEKGEEVDPVELANARIEQKRAARRN